MFYFHGTINVKQCLQCLYICMNGMFIDEFISILPRTSTPTHPPTQEHLHTHINTRAFEQAHTQAYIYISIHTQNSFPLSSIIYELCMQIVKHTVCVICSAQSCFAGHTSALQCAYESAVLIRMKVFFGMCVRASVYVCACMCMCV